MGAETIGESNAYKTAIQTHIEANNLEEHILFRPFSVDIFKFFNTIDVFIMATHGETYGMVTVEALCAGVPIIGSNSGGTVELLENGHQGTLFISKDSLDLSHKMKETIENMQLIRQRAANYKPIAKEKYSHVRECVEIENIFKTLMSK